MNSKELALKKIAECESMIDSMSKEELINRERDLNLNVDNYKTCEKFYNMQIDFQYNSFRPFQTIQSSIEINVTYSGTDQRAKKTLLKDDALPHAA